MGRHKYLCPSFGRLFTSRPSIKSLAVFTLLVGLLSNGPLARAGLTVDVQISGLPDALLNNARAYLSIEQQKTDPALSEEQLQRLHQRAAGEIAKALQPFGYYQPHIQGTLHYADGKWLARYQVDAGPPVHIADLDIQIEGEGAGDPEFNALINAFPVHRNDVLNHTLYENGKQSFQRFATEHGYFDFKLSQSEIAIDPAAHSAVITLHIDTGPHYRFGAVNFHQQALKPELLRRFVPFKAGDLYNTAQLLDLQNALLDSDYFNSVEINPRKDLGADRQIPVDVALTPRYQYRYTVGAGYGTDTGPRGKLGWENRRINDSGHRLSTEYKTSEIHDGLTARYSVPIRNPRSDQFAITTSWSNDHPKTSHSETFLLGASRSIDRGANWLETLYLNYQTESYSVGDDRGDSTMLLPGITWTKVTADNRIYPYRGLRLLLDVRGTHPALISNAQFLQVRAQAKFVHKIFGAGRILLRGDVGATRFGAIRTLPTSARFFAGGDQSVRGYAYNTLAPRNAAGQIVGGEQLLVGSVEYEQRFADKWSTALFYDAGNAMNNWQEDLKEGAGFGIRWRSPIGPIRFDLAWALSEPGAPKRLHITVGPDL